MHGSARRILTALLEQRAANGPALGVTALGRAGWPGEAARPDAVANRVYVALAFLRKQGLRGWLSREADGYRLVAQLRVVPAAGGWPTA